MQDNRTLKQTRPNEMDYYFTNIERGDGLYLAIFFYLSLRLFTWSFYRVHLIHLCHYFTPCRSIRSNTIQFIFIDIALMLQMCVKYDQIKRIKQKKSHDIKIKTAKSEAIEVLWSWRFFAVAKTYFNCSTIHVFEFKFHISNSPTNTSNTQTGQHHFF